ncbi:hypothetical protein OPU71_15570 [Niveibacterium sp. 24ML]|uniref:hypothetical protein n=1 Tax=Niveibacterium sp. 24ML TaxID=2985512 RepID=UPI00226DD431|nr:hypothetical protein [Niveibacterium sp. 24ML]MCX9157547.1 hypothetical protein [Niveibacterium sp. 24ML]
MLLGVSEGIGKTSTLDRCGAPVGEMLAAGMGPGCAISLAAPASVSLHPDHECATHVETPTVLTLRPVESAEQRSELGASARSADGEDCLRPAGPSSAAARLREHAREVGRKAPDRERRVPFSLVPFSWASKRKEPGRRDGLPAKARPQINNAHRKPHPTITHPNVGLRTTQPNLRNCPNHETQMFDHIVLRREEGGLPISAGQIAESMLYYQKVQVFIDRSTLLGLVRQLGTDGVLTLIRRPDISGVFCEEILGTQTNSVGVSNYHNFVAMRFSGNESTGELRSTQDRLQFDLESLGIARTKAKKFVGAFLERVSVRKLSGHHFLRGGITEAAKNDLSDAAFVTQAIRAAIAVTPGGYKVGDDFKFEVLISDLGAFVFSNLDLDGINKRRAAAVPSLEPLTIAHLLTNLLDARADLALAAFYGGDFVTSSVTSSIIQVRHAELLRRSKLNINARRAFTEVTLPDSPTVAEVIDAGERSFDEFLVMLDRAERFKSWLKTVSPDEGMIRSYMRDVTSEGWIQKLPAKSLRYLLTLALDATNPVVGVVAGFMDNFVVEKLCAGWRPNHFVSGRLGPFVRRD